MPSISLVVRSASQTAEKAVPTMSTPVQQNAATSVGRISPVAVKALDNAAAAFLQYRATTPAFNVHTVLNEARKLNAEDQLWRAEVLMDEAYRRISDPNANEVDKMRAWDEVNKAEEIRDEVRPQLSQAQQKAMDKVTNDEVNGIVYAGNPDRQYGDLDYHVELGQRFFGQGMQENRSLIDWIESD